LDFDPLRPHEKSFHGYAIPVRLNWADPAYPDDAFSVALFSKHTAHRTRTGMSFSLATQLAVGGERMVRNLHTDFGQDVQRGQWHHYAFTWSRKHRRVRQYHNGRLVNEWRGFVSNHFLPERFEQWRVFERAYLRLHYGRVVIDELRLSFTERSTDELGAHGDLKPDRHTALLLNFDDADDTATPTTYQPAHAATSAAREPIPLASDHHLTEGRLGKGLALYAEPAAPDTNH
ncbi:MAG: hypothetical protein ACODAQ_11840, partial [Phycisphaeraceae bacterium]